MNKFKIMVIGGAMFLCSLPIMSKKYFLYSTFINNGKHTQNGAQDNWNYNWEEIFDSLGIGHP